jgi:hypothetical protein
MKKAFFLLAIAIVLVVGYATNGLATGGTTQGATLCYGIVTEGQNMPYPPSAGATVRCIEDGSTATTLTDGSFILSRNGKKSVGTYHIIATKAPCWRSDTLSFYYDGSFGGTNVGEVHMRPVD